MPYYSKVRLRTIFVPFLDTALHYTSPRYSLNVVVTLIVSFTTYSSTEGHILQFDIPSPWKGTTTPPNLATDLTHCQPNSCSHFTTHCTHGCYLPTPRTYIVAPPRNLSPA